MVGPEPFCSNRQLCETADVSSTFKANGNFDAVIIGAGVIGAATAFELGRRGWRTLCVDKMPAAGFGSTINSCAIVRFTYSTFNGVAMAYEGLRYWQNWSDYLEAEDEAGLIEYRECGMVQLKDPGGHWGKGCSPVR